METNQFLNVTVDNARKAYKDADDKGKLMLENLYTKRVLLGNVMQRVSNAAEAREELGIEPSVNVYADAADDYERAEIDIKLVAKALREGKHESECFYYPFFDRSGGGFSYYVYAYDYGFANVGARLRVDTAEKARHLGECMLSSYKLMLTGK